MRIRSFEAKSMNEAMRLIREQMGEDAVIISTTRGKDGVQVTAAIEDAPIQYTSPDEGGVAVAEASAPRAKPAGARQEEESAENRIYAILRYHNMPGYLAEQLWHSASTITDKNTETTLLHVLEHNFNFGLNNAPREERATMLVGPPGVGKTMTTAKMATEAVLNRTPVTVITTDATKAGSMEQLKSFTDILKAPLFTAATPAELKSLLKNIPENHYVLIDSAGANPYDSDELRATGALISAGSIEPVLVCAAGMDVNEAADMAANFAYLGIDRMIVTKVDATRRLGSVLTAAHAGNLAFSHFSSHAGAVDGLEAVTPTRLAGLLMQCLHQKP